MGNRFYSVFVTRLPLIFLATTRSICIRSPEDKKIVEHLDPLLPITTTVFRHSLPVRPVLPRTARLRFGLRRKTDVQRFET